MNNNKTSPFEKEVTKAAQRYLNVTSKLKDKTYNPLLCFTSLNLFLWHLKAFKKNSDPTKELAEKFENASNFIENTIKDKICNDSFLENKEVHFYDFEKEVSSLFSDVWVDMDDEIYFDQSYNFTCERLSKNGIDPEQFFKDKIVIDAGCGGGKFTAAIAKLGAKKVIGIDIGEKGLNFAKDQAKKVNYGRKITYTKGNLLNIPVDDNNVDMVWSNGVIHHTLNYKKCIQEFSRVTKSGGELFLYVNGKFGLFELLQDTIRKSMEQVPRHLFQFFLKTLGVDTGRLYWLMDCCFAPYEYRSKEDVINMLKDNGYKNIKQLLRGISTDQIEQISQGLPYSNIKYGEGQLKFLCSLN